MPAGRLAILTSHPVQYYGPLFRTLAREIDIHVFFAHRASPDEQARAGFGIPFEWDVNLTSGYACSFLKNIARHPGTDHFAGCDTPEIGDHLRRGSFHALLVMGWHLKTYLQAMVAAKRLQIPVMVRGDSQLNTPRSHLKRALKGLAYPWFLRRFDAALYVGQRSRAYYLHYGYPTDQLFFSPHCVDAAWFHARATQAERERLRAERGIRASTLVLLFAGKLLAFKRPSDLVFAAARCIAQGLDVEVMVAGSGPLEKELMAAAAACGVRIHLLGFLNQTEMPAAYAAADCLILPSEGDETWGLVANEALACSRPIIVSDACGCAPDLASDNNVGRTFPVGESERLAKAIGQVAMARPSDASIFAITRMYSLEAAAAGIVCALNRVHRRA